MHLVIAGPYEVLYTTAVDIWSFGCLLLNMLIGKCGPLKQRGVRKHKTLQLHDKMCSHHCVNLVQMIPNIL